MYIKRAVLDDAKGIAKVHVDSWKTTYRNIIPDEFLKNLSYDQRTDTWYRNISIEGNFVFVAVNNEGEIVGFADCGTRESNYFNNTGDLSSIYLLEEYHGKGIGKQLLKQIFLQFRELGFHKVFVEVLELNKTRYFYEYYGAQLVSTEGIVIGGAPLNLLIYEWNNLNSVLTKLN